jgi:hypothetical protein
LALALAMASVGCSEPVRDARPSFQDGTGLPLWAGRPTQVFDDNIDPQALGLTMEGTSPRADPFLRERAQTAEVVARVRVQTVTSESVGDNITYHLGVQVGVPTLAKPKIPDLEFELLIKPASPSFSIAKQFDAGLRNKTFIGFFRRFANADGELVVHFHLAPDTAEVAAAVKEAVALGEFAGT